MDFAISSSSRAFIGFLNASAPDIPMIYSVSDSSTFLFTSHLHPLIIFFSSFQHSRKGLTGVRYFRGAGMHLHLLFMFSCCFVKKEPNYTFRVFTWNRLTKSYFVPSKREREREIKVCLRRRNGALNETRSGVRLIFEFLNIHRNLSR